MHFQTFIFWDFCGFGGFSEMIVLKKYIYIYVCVYMFVNKRKLHMYIYNMYTYTYNYRLDTVFIS